MQDLLEEQDAVDIEGDEIDFESGFEMSYERDLSDAVMARAPTITYKEYKEILSIYE